MVAGFYIELPLEGHILESIPTIPRWNLKMPGSPLQIFGLPAVSLVETLKEPLYDPYRYLEPVTILRMICEPKSIHSASHPPM